jgi:hypothetical protein
MDGQFAAHRDSRRGGVSTTSIQRTIHVFDPTIQVILLWVVFFVTTVIINVFIPFILGVNLREWTYSPIKFMLSGFVVYALLFMVVPLILIKGWDVLRQPSFLLPLVLAIVALTLWYSLRGIAVVAVIVLAYLHRRFNLSEYGIRSCGWKGDILAILIIASLGLVPLLLSNEPYKFAPVRPLSVASFICQSCFHG